MEIFWKAMYFMVIQNRYSENSLVAITHLRVCYIVFILLWAIQTIDSFKLDLFDYDADIDSDGFATFGGLKGRAQPKQDSPIERDLALTLEEIFNGAVKKMKISRKVCLHDVDTLEKSVISQSQK